MKLRVLLGALALTVAVSALAPADAEAGRKYRRHRHRHHGLSIFQHRHHESRAYRYYARPVIIAPRVYYDSYADDRYYYDDDYDYDDGYYDRRDDDYGYAARSYRRGYYHVHRDRHYCPYPRYRYRPHIGVGGRGGHFGFYVRF